jgi:hypothetical protein
MHVDAIAASAFQSRKVRCGILSAPDTKVGVTKTASRPPPVIDALPGLHRALTRLAPRPVNVCPRLTRTEPESVAHIPTGPGANGRDEDHQPNVQLTLAGEYTGGGEHTRAHDRYADP